MRYSQVFETKFVLDKTRTSLGMVCLQNASRIFKKIPEKESTMLHLGNQAFHFSLHWLSYVLAIAILLVLKISDNAY